MKLPLFRSLFSLLLLATVLIPTRAQAPAALRLPGLISDNMVLQSGTADRIWGWAASGQTVTVALNGQSKTAVADPAGKWELKLDPLTPGGPYQMTVQAGGSTLTVKNILIGEVWVCSGQSNMAMVLIEARNGADEVAHADDPQLRVLGVPPVAINVPQDDMNGRWVEVHPAMAANISAVAYFFGRKLRQELKEPVGLITSSWGGTNGENWMSGEALRSTPALALLVQKQDAARKSYPQDKVVYDQKMADVAAEMKKHPEYHQDDTGWEAPGLAEKGWQPMRLPQLWTDAGIPLGGRIWFRRAVDIPAGWVGKDLALSLGKINNADITYVNGVKVGQSAELAADRHYTIPASAVTGTHFVLAIKVMNYYGRGGFAGTTPQMTLQPVGEAGAPPVSLAGDWKYEVSDGHLPQPDMPPGDPTNPGQPSCDYNGMIAPLEKYAIAGAIWYQGEGNAGKSYQYRSLLPALIKDWRAHWGIGDFPFLVVQLANFMSTAPQPSESGWAELREAQLMNLSTPNTGLAVTIDIGEGDNIHYLDKQDVGVRLALWALAKKYGQTTLVYSGPLWKSMTVENGKIRLTFSELGAGLASRDGKPLSQFAIAGADKKFVWADAMIDGDTVVVSSPSVPNPVAVRYAWGDNPAGCNLVNKEGLPASPFRTDDWPGVTANAN